MSKICSSGAPAHTRDDGFDWNAPQQVLDNAAQEITRELASGDAEFALRITMDALKRLQALNPQKLEQPPSTGDARYDTLLAAGARMVLQSKSARTPDWGQKLARPWYPGSETRRMSEAYKALTRRRTPRIFADHNIFLKDSSLG